MWKPAVRRLLAPRGVNFTWRPHYPGYPGLAPYRRWTTSGQAAQSEAHTIPRNISVRAEASSSLTAPAQGHTDTKQGGALNWDTKSPANASYAPNVTLQPEDLYQAAKLARLSGLCYLQGSQEGELERRVAAEGMRLVASGDTYFTRWFIADEDEQSVTRGEGLEEDLSPAGPSSKGRDSEPAAGGDHAGAAEGTVRRRVVVMRGVVWRADAVEPLRLWQALAKFWPTPLAAEATHPPGSILAHSGAAGMAEDLFEQLKEYFISQPQDGGELHYTFAGHSMGGSLALLTACLARLRAAVPPSRLRCYTFGSPPTLSSASGHDGDRVLEVLGVPRSAVKTFVLDNDPVPRAMLSVDPSFTMLKKVAPLRGLLEMREWWLGQGASFTPNRFLYDTVGELHYIRWSPEEGHQVVPLDRTTAAEQLEMAVDDLMRQPVAAMAALLDHAHSSYAHDLESAARMLQRRQARRESLC